MSTILPGAEPDKHVSPPAAAPKPPKHQANPRPELPPPVPGEKFFPPEVVPPVIVKGPPKEPKPPKQGHTLAELYELNRVRAEERRKNHPQFSLWEAWGLYMQPGGGPPIANLGNAVAILENDPNLKGTVWYDAFLQRILTAPKGAAATPREWSDHDDINLALYMQTEVGIAKIGREIVSQAVISVAHRAQRNCVTDWLDTLSWDGTERISLFLSDHFGAEDSDYTRSASKNFWLSIIARAYHPGCKVDNMLVLEGPQGIGKSSALQIIAGPWFAEQHESATNPKAFCEILQGKLLIEISEMDSFSRAETNRVKQTISCQSDRFRSSYARHAADHPRTCIFVGTTNRSDWHRDETGARRFWPISCHSNINLNSIQSARTQLFAESTHLHKSSTTIPSHWQMPLAETLQQQTDRFQADPWLDSISNSCSIIESAFNPISSPYKFPSLSTTNILINLGFDLKDHDKSKEMRAASCLRFLGWTRIRARSASRSNRPIDNRNYLYCKLPPTPSNSLSST